MPFSKRDRIVKKAVKKTVSEFSDRTPKLQTYFFYGATELAPQNLAIWYLFRTDAELKAAKSSGYCAELEKATVRNLIDLGYPQEAFAPANDETDEAQQNNYRKATISFTTREDVDNKADGDYRMYFQ